ncbi:MAG: hypothetical protein CL662_01020 [Bacteroidetes bacterium]|nr:hypothetical protein [Bacteroidota bacterium]|tara:strand:+ start:297 stop:872 length:576 start_codon:yes stop_codon:yes gene_type:complete
MRDNVLKKEFSKKDVNRIRNLVQGKHGDKTTQSIGYSKSQEFHKEGDIWESKGQTWTIKNGVKQNITKLDKAKKAVKVPLFCPCCNKLMKKHMDPQYYKVHKMCYDCVIDKEHEIKKQGKWEEYQKQIHNSDIDGIITDYKAFVEAALNESNESFITEGGDVENWVGGINKERAKEALEKGVEYLKSKKIK